MLSAPGVHFSALTEDSEFLLARYTPTFVHGSFFTKVYWVLRGHSGKAYGVSSDSNSVQFDVFDLGRADQKNLSQTQKLIYSKNSVWTEWWLDGIRVYYKQATIFVRAGGWEVNCTRKPIYNQIKGTSKWHFDLSMRMLDGKTGFERFHDTASTTCFPHGVIGQSYDSDDIAVDGATDDYSHSNLANPVIITRAQAEGAIEGKHVDYITSSRFNTSFHYSRFHRQRSDACASRDVSLLTGKKRKKNYLLEIASTSEEQ